MGEKMDKREDACRCLPEECQVEHYVEALKNASARVRHVMVTLTIASILIFVGYSNSRRDSWFAARIELARASADAWGPDTTDLNTVFDGLRVEIREKEAVRDGDGDGDKQTSGKTYSMLLDTDLTTAPQIDDLGDKGLKGRVAQWIQNRNITSRSSIEDIIRIMEEARTENAVVMRMPILGLAFDVNDLGLFSGISFVVLMIMLIFSLSRYHESLFLSLWKVRQICKDERRPCDRGSEANLVYHSLAMAQVFSKPPSLARPTGGGGRSLSRIILIVPLLIQGLIFWHDSNTMDIGQMFNDQSTATSIGAQLFCIAVVLILTLICLAYTRSSEIRWRNTFLAINPCLKGVRQPSWLEWVALRKPKMDYEGDFQQRYKRMLRAESSESSENNEAVVEPVATDGPAARS